jgi:hypothetical protein
MPSARSYEALVAPGYPGNGLMLVPPLESAVERRRDMPDESFILGTDTSYYRQRDDTQAALNERDIPGSLDETVAQGGYHQKRIGVSSIQSLIALADTDGVTISELVEQTRKSLPGVFVDSGYIVKSAKALIPAQCITQDDDDILRISERGLSVLHHAKAHPDFTKQGEIIYRDGSTYRIIEHVLERTNDRCFEWAFNGESSIIAELAELLSIDATSVSRRIYSIMHSGKGYLLGKYVPAMNVGIKTTSPVCINLAATDLGRGYMLETRERIRQKEGLVDDTLLELLGDIAVRCMHNAQQLGDKKTADRIRSQQDTRHYAEFTQPELRREIAFLQATLLSQHRALAQ